jgi:regulator of sirC expression with transglutaminase-like and TPR domain
MDKLSARQFFQQETEQPDQQIDLVRAAIYIALEEYPYLDVEEYLNAIETMAAELQERLPSAPYPLKIIQTINHYLYEDLGFVGNTTNYYDPRNSFLNEVIDRRTGIPITLSLVYLAIAERIDFPMVGVGMPGHFLIRPDVEEMEIFVDAFHQGEILFPQDCQQRLSQVYQQPVELKPELLPTVSNRQFLARMLTNLKMIYLNQSNFPKALAVIDRILLLFPDMPLELRDRGILYYRLSRWQDARQDLQSYLSQVPTAEDALMIRKILQTIASQV